MLQASDTAYPRLKAHPNGAELETLFTPTLAEMAFALKQTRRAGPRVALLVLLRTFQRLGYFPRFADVPLAVIQHLAAAAECPEVGGEIRAYDNSTYRTRYMNRVRIFMQKANSPGTRMPLFPSCPYENQRETSADSER